MTVVLSGEVKASHPNVRVAYETDGLVARCNVDGDICVRPGFNGPQDFSIKSDGDEKVILRLITPMARGCQFCARRV